MKNDPLVFRFSETATALEKEAGVKFTSDDIEGRRLLAHIRLAKKGVPSDCPIKIEDTIFSMIVGKQGEGQVIGFDVTERPKLKIITEQETEHAFHVSTQRREKENEWRDEEDVIKTFAYRTHNGDLINSFRSQYIETKRENVEHIKDICLYWAQQAADSLCGIRQEDKVDDEISNGIKNAISALRFIPIKGSHKSEYAGRIFEKTPAPFFIVGNESDALTDKRNGRLKILINTDRGECSWDELIRSFPIELSADAQEFRNQNYKILNPDYPEIHKIHVHNADDKFHLDATSREGLTHNKVNLLSKEKLLKQEDEILIRGINSLIFNMKNDANGNTFSDRARTLFEQLRSDKSEEWDYTEWLTRLLELNEELQKDKKSLSNFLKYQGWELPISPIEFAILKSSYLHDMKLSKEKIVDKSPAGYGL